MLIYVKNIQKKTFYGRTTQNFSSEPHKIFSSSVLFVSVSVRNFSDYFCLLVIPTETVTFSKKPNSRASFFRLPGPILLRLWPNLKRNSSWEFGRNQPTRGPVHKHVVLASRFRGVYPEKGITRNGATSL